MKQSGISMAMALTAMACFFGGPQSQAANTFTAISGSDWNTAANWSEGVPFAGQEVVINGNATLTNATPALASLTVNSGKTLTFDGWDTLLSATTVTIDGTVTHAQNTATTTNSLGQWVPNARVNIACDTLTVSAGGKIDVTGKGFAGRVGYGVNGCGPGAGKGAAGGAGGGGYGGLGGSFSAPYGLAYGLPEEPEQPGSSGGSGNNALVFGGSGGGVIRIQASGGVQVDGSLLADGVAAVGFRCGGGSGGAIYITCSVISGTGVLSANGKAGIAAGGGGGGRIAVVYDPGAQALVALPGLQFATLPAKGLISGTIVANGDVGSLYFPDSQFLTRQSGPIIHSGEWRSGAILTGWSRDNLVLSNAWLRIPVEGFDLEVANNISIVGTDAYLSKLELTNATVAVGGNVGLAKSSLVLHRGSIGMTTLDCGGDLTLADSSALHVESIATNGLSTLYGARVSVDGDMDITGASWVYPASDPKTGGAVRFQVGGLRVASGAGFNASELGYAGGGIKSGMGYGPGGGYGSASGSGGGGYGGRGGLWNATSGKTYGLAYAPTEPGSGGGHDTGKAGVVAA